MIFAYTVGTLAKDPVLGESNNGTKFCRFLLIIDLPKSASGEKQTDILPVICWGKIAENVAKFKKRGHVVFVQGALNKKTFNKENEKIISYELNANNVQFLNLKNNENNNNTKE